MNHLLDDNTDQLLRVFAVPTDEHNWFAENSTGTRFRKQIVKFGKWVDPFNPKQKMSLTKQWAETVVKNFKAGVLGRIPVPSTHTDDPDKNRGELVDMIVTKDGIDGVMEIRDKKTVQDIKEGRLWDVSIGFYDNYLDKISGEEVGPAVFHVALVNNPYLKGMQGFQALANEHTGSVIMLSEQNIKELSMSKTITNSKEFDVEVTYTDADGKEVKAVVKAGETVEVPEEQAEAVEKQVSEAVAPETEEEKKKREEEEAAEAKKKADEEEAERKKKEEEDAKKTDEEKQAEKNAELADENAKLKVQLAEKEANESYQKLLSDGKITPAMKDSFLELSRVDAGKITLSDGKTESSVSELVAKLLSEAPNLVKLDEEAGNGSADNKSAYALLSDEERAVVDKLGVSSEDYDKTHPVDGEGESKDNDSSDDDDDDNKE